MSKVKVKGDPYLMVTYPKMGKGRLRRFFKATPEGKKEAETFMSLKKAERLNYGAAGIALTESERAEYIECRELLRPFGVTIKEAVLRYLPELKARNRSCTAKELAAELIKMKEADGASRRYLGDLRSRLNQFAAAFNGQTVATISEKQIDGWLRALPVAATTRNNFRRVLIVAFSFARKEGYCAGNPAKETAKAKEVETAVGILTVDQLSSLLENAPASLLPFVAIGAFAGLRRAEIERLDWSEVDLASGLIEVVAKKAKSARRRFVKIRPNLDAWIRPHAKQSGPVTPSDYRELLDTAREAAGIEDWPQNALRHGFASYDLASRNDAAALALELGHTNSNLVFQHYRQLVKPAQAKRYWDLMPAVEGNVVAFEAEAKTA
jgi:integrase